MIEDEATPEFHPIQREAADASGSVEVTRRLPFPRPYGGERAIARRRTNG